MQHIIVVDDDRLQLEIVEQMLAKSNYQISTYTHSQELLDCIQHISADLILIDLSLPDVNGFALCEYIREIEGFAHIPIIAFSADVSLSIKIKSQLTGFDGFIEKPFRQTDFCRKIASYLTPVSDH